MSGFNYSFRPGTLIVARHKGEGAPLAVAEPRTGFGTEIHRFPSAGLGGGQTALHTRFNVSMQPLGMSFTNTTVADDSPALAELVLPANCIRRLPA